MDLARAVLEGHAASGARLIRLLEDGDAAGVEALRRVYPASGRAWLLGVTGPPGAGKSTLVSGLISELRRRGRRVGVIAVDPSSPFSGGAILGDRVRMQQHAADPGVFIRSMATRGQLGGLSRTAFETSVVLDAMGHDVVLIETVGVGQDEVDVAGLAHTTLVVSIPGMGDEIQAIKAGILEVGDVFAINKADRPGADAAEQQLRLMLRLRESSGAGWQPPLLRTVAAREEGIGALLDACEAHRRHLAERGDLQARDARRRERFFLELLRSLASSRLLERAAADPRHATLLDDVRAQRIDPYGAAERLVAWFEGSTAGER